MGGEGEGGGRPLWRTSRSPPRVRSIVLRGSCSRDSGPAESLGLAQGPQHVKMAPPPWRWILSPARDLAPPAAQGGYF